MAEYEDRERFIPYRKAEIVDMLCADGRLSEDEQNSLRAFCKILESLYHFEFHDKVENLKDNYYPFNPDKDTKSTRQYSSADLAKCRSTLVEKFREVLNDANYEQLEEKDIEAAMSEESLFNISLFVDFDDFESYALFSRGDAVHQVEIKKFGFLKQTIDVPVYERVAMLIEFKDAAYFESKGRKIPFEPGSMVIKLFKNIPKADLEMLFPNTETRMKPKDKLMMGGPAAAGGIGVLLKAGGGLIAAVTVIWGLIASIFSGGEVDMADKGPQMVGGLTALAVIGGFVFKQWTKYKNRKILFMKTLADSLYFKNLDNNAGVFHHIIDAAEEEECKEAMLGYYFLLGAANGLTEPDLDDEIEKWFEKNHQTQIDFEVDDALRKLRELELMEEAGEDREKRPIYKAKSLADACERLDYIWDNYFQYNV